LRRSAETGDFIDRAIKWLLNVETIQINQDTMQASKKFLKVDLSLRGWPWLPGEGTWIEPTALTMLALESIPGPEVTKRLNEAFLYIQDRRCPDGGWNVGSPAMFNLALPGRGYPTAMVLLALFKSGLGNIQGNDISFLRSEMLRDGSVLTLAWGLLALRTLGEDDVWAEARLSALQGQNGGWGDSPYKTAAAVMALKRHL
jgi:hypothetical protein